MPPPRAAAYFAAQRDGETLQLRLHGRWRALELGAIGQQLAAVELGGVRRVSLLCADSWLDLSGAWLLEDFMRRAKAAGAEVSFEDQPPPTLTLVQKASVEEQSDAAPEPTASPAELNEPSLVAALAQIGRRTVRNQMRIVRGLAFVGRSFVVLLKCFRHPRLFKPTSIARHVYDTGITAVPIVALIAFLISVIIAYMGADQLRKFGADIYVVDLVTIGVLRELGVLLTAIIVAGRSGSAFAAEIGAMQLNEEVDALEATGVDPVAALVLPRMLGLIIALPLLTVLADAVGLAGGGLLCHELLQMPLAQYLNRMNESIADTTFWVGIIKAPFFAVLIAVAGTWYGMQVRGSSRELGRLTTTAVVVAIFMVILADALFAVLFTKLDI